MCCAFVKLKLKALNHPLCSYWIKIWVNSKFLGFLLANATPRFLFFYKFNTCCTQIEHHFNFQPFCIFFRFWKFLVFVFCFFLVRVMTNTWGLGSLLWVGCKVLVVWWLKENSMLLMLSDAPPSSVLDSKWV